MKYGYDDFTVALFEKETGIKVPVQRDDPARFRRRFDFLTGSQKGHWLAWRCDKIFDLHKRLLKRIRQASPGAKLFLTYFGPSTRSVLATDTLGQMREVGMDPAQYAAEPGIVVIQGGMYGRRYSTPLADAQVIEPSLYDRQAIEISKWGGRGRCMYTAYFEYGKSAEFDRLGGKDVFINDCCVPSGVNQRELYAMALADGDSSFIINGGAGWMFGTPRLMQPFLREYRALPAVQFQPWDKARDPVAIWFHKPDRQNRGFVFYAVNRLPVPVTVTISVRGQGRTLKSPVDGKTHCPGQPGAALRACALHAEELRFRKPRFRARRLHVFRSRGIRGQDQARDGLCQDAAGRSGRPPDGSGPLRERRAGGHPHPRRSHRRALPRASIGRPGESTGLR